MKHNLIWKKFDRFGLTTYEAKSYISLLERNNLTAPELSRVAGIPRAKIYETLENLITKGLCTSEQGKVKKYSATNPSVLRDLFYDGEKTKALTQIDQLKKEVKEKEKKLSNVMASTDEMVDDLTDLFKKSRSQNDPLNYIEIIRVPMQFHKRFCQLIENSEKETLVFTKAPYSVSKEDLIEQPEAEKNILKKGVICKSIYEIPKTDEEKEWLYDKIEKVTAAGEQARVIDELPMKMAIFDERIVVYVLEDPVLQVPSLTTQIIEHRSLAKSLKILFETIWGKAMDFHTLKSEKGGQ